MYFYPGILLFLKFLLWRDFSIIVDAAAIALNHSHDENRENIFLNKSELDEFRTFGGNDFSYCGSRGPKFWHFYFPTCGGQRQSPINVRIADLQIVDFDDLRWNNGYSTIPPRITVVNTGKTVKIETYFGQNPYIIPLIIGGPMSEPYALEEIHFHWGTGDHFGSEHTINQKTFPMEMHAVHYKLSAGSFNNALQQPDGLVVVGYFFEISNRDNVALNSILERKNELQKTQDVEIPLINTFRLTTLLDPFTSDYVTYNGSLTAPPCSESVIWILSPYTIEISRRQLYQFREIARAGGFENNFRNTQPLNGRPVLFAT